MLLVAAGYDAIHVGELNLLGVPDTDVIAAARRDRRCVVSVDTDFGELLAVGSHTNPVSCSAAALLTGHWTRPRS